MNLYLAHPISGLSYEQVASYYNYMREELSPAWTILSPMTGKGELRNEARLKAFDYDNPIATNKAIVHRDFWMVSRADAIYLDLLGTTAVSIGCVAELSWAWAHQIHTIVSVDRDNIHWHAFVIEMADIILPRPEAIAYLNKLAKGEE
jgi:nucleoside 2-deoxyribosyltransferase